MGPLTFYFDRNFGKRFPQALGHTKPPFQIEYHHSENNRFAQDMRDDEWLRICGQRGWIGFSQDKLDKIPVEAMAIKQHRVAAFALWGAQLPVWGKCCHFFRAYPRIQDIVRNERPPYFYRVSESLRFVKVDLP